MQEEVERLRGVLKEKESELEKLDVAPPTNPPPLTMWQKVKRVAVSICSYIYLNRVYYSVFNPLKPKLNPICYLLVLLGVHHFLHVSRIRVKSLIFMLLMSYIYGAPILDVSRSHTTTQHSR